ncbi:MAG TPA: hypothetical protein VLT86_17635 [Vicinamibacterales bacterium]|nr:hypothetical protein [Vicinamibacterales bacterium]
MPSRPRIRRSALALAAFAAIGIGLAPGRTVAAQKSDVSIVRVLRSAADYLDGYDRQFSAVVSEEHYLQVMRRGASVAARRTLVSDLILISAGEAGWLSYRDVYDVDGKLVRDRQPRLYDLFLHPAADAVQQAEKIYSEGARYNLGPIKRSINVPTMALPFLRRENQRRSVFEVKDQMTVNGLRTAVLHFSEESWPRMIETSDDSPASGRFWIEMATGRVLRTELIVESRDGRDVITVTYAPQPKLGGLWVPVRMDERYAVSATTSIDGTATYTGFRQFNVDVGTIIK